MSARPFPARVPMACALLACCLLAGLACAPREPSDFGKPCARDRDCAAGLFCDAALGQCAPPVDAGPAPPKPPVPGHVCKDALPMVPLDDGSGLARWRASATLDADTTVDTPSACAPVSGGGGGDTASLVLSLVAGVPMVLRVRIDAPGAASISVLDGACAAELDYGCASSADAFESGALDGGREIVLPLVAGELRLLVRAASLDGASVEAVVSAEQVRCPPGALPDGEDCIGFVPIAGPAPRTDHQVTLLDDNAFVTGGIAEAPLVEAEIYDPSRRTWRRAPLFDTRVGHAAAASEGVLFLMGGSETSYERFDPELAGGTFVRGDDDLIDANIDLEFPGSTLTALATDVPFLFVGSSAPLLATLPLEGGPCSGDFQCRAGLVCMQRADPGIALFEGICLCASGTCGLAQADPDWSPLSAPQSLRHRRGHVACNVSPRERSPEIVVIGGANDEGLARPALFNLDARAWVTLAASSTPMLRDRPAGVCDREQVIVVGGVDAAGAPTAVVERFAPFVDRVLSTTTLRRPRADAALALFGDDAIVIGGHDGTDTLATSELIRRGTGAVRNGPLLPFPLRGARAVALNDGTVLVVGGATDEGLAVEALVLARFPADLALPDLRVSDVGGDRCEAPLVLSGSEGAIEGSTFGMLDDLDLQFIDATCTSEGRSEGIDVVHELTVPAQSALRIEALAENEDVVLYAYASCPIAGPCLAGADVGFDGDPEVIEVANPTDTPLPILVVVDAFNEALPYSYELLWGPP